MVGLGMVQVLEGRRCFGHLTVEENIIAGAYSRKLSKGDMQAELDRIYAYFKRLKDRRKSQAGYTSGGEQQMTAVARAMMAKPKMLLLDEPSMGLAPQLVAEIFNIVQELNKHEGVSILLAEQNTNIALRNADYGYIIETGLRDAARLCRDAAATTTRSRNSTSASPRRAARIFATFSARRARSHADLHHG